MRLSSYTCPYPHPVGMNVGLEGDDIHAADGLSCLNHGRIPVSLASFPGLNPMSQDRLNDLFGNKHVFVVEEDSYGESDN